MANSYVEYTGNGSTTNFSITFDYLDSSHLACTVDGSSTSFTLSSGGTVATISPAPANAAKIKFVRTTSQSSRLTDYQAGSVLKEEDLDTDSKQAFFMSQESLDDVASKLGQNISTFQFDAVSKRITNVATPTGTNDAANKAYVDNVAGSATTATTQANNAAASATAAANAQAAAEAALDTFDDDYLGSKSSDPTLDNDGDALADGSLYFNTSDNRMKVYDLGTTSWNYVSPSGADQTKINNVSDNMSAVTNVSTNLSSVQNFADVYRVASSAPATSLDVGDLYFDTTANELKVYKSSGWAAAGSTVNGTSRRYTYNITGTPTTVSGADAKGSTLAYDAGFVDVYLNGVRLSNSSGSYTGDVTVSSGTSVVFANALAAGDVVDVVAYGTFSAAAIDGSDITSGTINDARLPTTMASKTLTTATVEADSLTARGDGSSNAGKILLNCENNSHAVKIQSPAHSAGQSYTLILPTSVGAANQVLATNGSSTNQLSWIDATETKPTVANVSQTIAPATATTITITGTNFVSIPQVDFVNGSTGAVTRANTVSFTSATSLSVNCTLALGNYYVRIENPDGNAGRSTNNIITASTAPTFSTSAGSLGTIAGDFSGTVATIAGSSDSAITFSETTSVLTNASQANCSLNSSTGVITTSDFGGSSTTATTYNFTIQIQDAEGQTATRDFSLTSSFGATGGGQFN